MLSREQSLGESPCRTQARSKRLARTLPVLFAWGRAAPAPATHAATVSFPAPSSC